MTTTQPCTCPKCQPTPPPASAPEPHSRSQERRFAAQRAKPEGTTVFAGQCSHGTPIGQECEKCKSPVWNRPTTPMERWLKEEELQAYNAWNPGGYHKEVVERLCALLDDKEADLARWKEMYGEECDAGNLLEKLRLKAEADLASIRSERSKLDQRITDECLARESAERDLAAAREREGKLAMEVTGMQRENSRLTARCIQAEADLAAARVELGLVSGALVDAGEVPVGSTGTEYAAAIGDLTRRLAATQGRERKLREALIRLEAAADAYCADQRTATNKHVGLVQPITVEQGEELNCALVEAATALAATKED